MQYIQLQGQVASQLELPIEGSYNLFIDTTDNSIKAKDSDGNLSGGGGISLIEVSRNEIGQLVASGSLTPGAFYKINGAASRSFYENNSIGYNGMGNEIQDGGTTIILQATSTKTLSKKGVGLFYVPNYEDPNNPTVAPDYNYKVWDNTHRLNFTNLNGRFDHDEYVFLHSSNTTSGSEGVLVGNIGGNTLTFIYDSSNDKFFNDGANFTGLSITGSNSNASASIVDYEYTSSYNSGDKVIWGGRVWQNQHGNVGYHQGSWPMTQLHLNTYDWTVVDFNETDYTIVADLIEYEFEWDNISYRKSKNNVEVRCDAVVWLDYWGYNTMKYVPWGHYGTSNISINNSYLDAFVNYPHDSYAGGITFKDYGGFNAHYWGHSTDIYNISSDFGGHMVSLNLGWNTRIENITLGQGAYLSDIYTYDNDNGNTALQNIVIGDNAQISGDYNPIYMYHNSYMDNLILETNSTITDINLYNGSSIRDTKLGIRSYIQSIALSDYADFRQVEIGNSSYIANINIGVSGCFKRTKLGIDCYIEYCAIGLNGYLKHIEMSDQSYMYCNVIGDYSYFQYNTLGINAGIYGINQQYGYSNFEYVTVGNNSHINAITLGTNCSFNHITIGSDSAIDSINASGADGAYVRHIDLKNTAYFSSINMESGSYIRRIDLGTDSEIGSINLTTNTSISDFQFGTDSGMGGITLYSGSSLYAFEIGNNSGFGGYDFTSSIGDVTIRRGFNNFKANEFEVTGSTNTSYATNDYQNAGSTLNSDKGIHLIDVSGQTQTLSWYLQNGDYEGQEVTFLLKNDGTATIASNQVWIFLDTLRDGIGGLQTSVPWYPFEQANGGNWRNNGKAIWIDGAWNIDNGQWD